MYGDYVQVRDQVTLMQMEAELRRMQHPRPVVPLVIGVLVGIVIGWVLSR
jgi:hypothetical protein